MPLHWASPWSVDVPWIVCLLQMRKQKGFCNIVVLTVRVCTYRMHNHISMDFRYTEVPFSSSLAPEDTISINKSSLFQWMKPFRCNTSRFVHLIHLQLCNDCQKCTFTGLFAPPHSSPPAARRPHWWPGLKMQWERTDRWGSRPPCYPQTTGRCVGAPASQAEASSFRSLSSIHWPCCGRGQREASCQSPDRLKNIKVL